MKFNQSAEMYGIIGKSVSGSFSPYIYNYLFNYYGISAVYMAFNVEEKDFEDAVKGIKALGFKGINITNPFKERAGDYISVKQTDQGVINTIKNINDKSIGFNTDYYGFVEFFKYENIELRDKKILMLGSGSTANTICGVLADVEVGELIILNRNVDKAKIMVNNFAKRRIFCKIGELNTENINLYIKNVDIIIDATSCNLLLDTNLKIHFKEIQSDKKLFFDVKYNPDTMFIQEAKKWGFDVHDGLGMLIFQAFKNFEIWTGIYPHMDFYTEIYNTLNTEKTDN